MTAVSWIPVACVALMTAATILLGIYATRKAKTASDFFVAGRSVSVFWNASAISGEYLSAASFLGIAGLLMKNGYDALWYPVCYATGYLFLLLFIAGPLRRFGAYTIPDFAEGRFDSPGFRKVAVTFVLFIGFFYTMPQMKGAGLTMGTILNWPYWAGIVIVGSVITFNVAFGGMKGITFVQAFQYWAKLFAISLPIFVLGSVFGGYSENLARNNDPYDVTKAPRAAEGTRVRIKGPKDYPANVLNFSGRDEDQVEFPDGATIKFSTARTPGPGEDPGLPIKMLARADRAILLKPGERLPYRPLKLPADGAEVRLDPGTLLVVLPHVPKRGAVAIKDGLATVRTSVRATFQAPTELTLISGPVPNAPQDANWLRPFGPFTSEAWPSPALHLFPDHRPDLRDGRPAAHPGPVLHQPRRPGGEADDALGDGDARELLRLPARLGRAGPEPRCRSFTRATGPIPS